MGNKTGETRISRRDALKLTGAGGVALIAGLIPDTALAAAKVATGRRLAMVIDLRKCTGCHACAVACKSEFGVPLGVWRSWVKQVEVGTYPNVRRKFLPRLCNHCDDPPCVKACPTGASYQKEDGTVQIKENVCIGCRLCMAACPYSARFINPEKKAADKCTFCIHRVDKGIVPACVNTCHANARVFGDLNNPQSEVAKLVATQSVQVLKPELGTRPQVFYVALDQETMGRIEEN